MLLIGAIALALLLLPPGWGIAVVTAAAVIEVAEIAFWIHFLRRYQVRTGIEALIGSTAEVIEACHPRGRVRFRGEIWHAHCDAGARVGDRVTVAGIDGLTLEVERSSGSGVYPKADPERRGGTEKGPGEGALWFRKDVPPAKSPSPARRSFKPLWLFCRPFPRST